MYYYYCYFYFYYYIYIYAINCYCYAHCMHRYHATWPWHICHMYTVQPTSCYIHILIILGYCWVLLKPCCQHVIMIHNSSVLNQTSPSLTSIKSQSFPSVLGRYQTISPKCKTLWYISDTCLPANSHRCGQISCVSHFRERQPWL